MLHISHARSYTLCTGRGVTRIIRAEGRSCEVIWLIGGVQSVPASARGSGGMPPRKILDFRPSEIISGAVLGKNNSVTSHLAKIIAIIIARL